MAMELHDHLTGLINQALRVEDELTAQPYREPVEHICKLDELRNHRLQAEELLRCTSVGSEKSESDFGAIFRDVAERLEREIRECEKCVETTNVERT